MEFKVKSTNTEKQVALELVEDGRGASIHAGCDGEKTCIGTFKNGELKLYRFINEFNGALKLGPAGRIKTNIDGDGEPGGGDEESLSLEPWESESIDCVSVKYDKLIIENSGQNMSVRTTSPDRIGTTIVLTRNKVLRLRDLCNSWLASHNENN